MNRTRNDRVKGMARGLSLAVLLALLNAAGAFAAAPTAPAARPATLEQQVTHLEGALAEGLRTRDWKILEMAVQGFKAVGLSGATAELSFLRAERQAAWENTNFGARRAQMEAWGLATRAKFGDTKALAALHALAPSAITAVQPPAQALFRTNHAEAQAAQKAFAAYSLALEKRDHALFCLAQLKDPGAGQSAMAALHAREKASASPMGGMVGFDSSSQLALAALAADPQAGWKGLLEFCGAEDEKSSVDVQIATFNFLLGLANPPKFQPADAPFRVDQELAALLPKDAAAQLVKSFAVLAKRWKPDANYPLNCSLLTATYNLPQLADNTELVSALEGLKTKFTGPNSQFLVQQADAAIKKLQSGAVAKDATVRAPAVKDANGVAPAAKPPKAPDEGF